MLMVYLVHSLLLWCFSCSLRLLVLIRALLLLVKGRLSLLLLGVAAGLETLDTFLKVGEPLRFRSCCSRGPAGEARGCVLKRGGKNEASGDEDAVEYR
jgi:hypothetical protein